MSSMDEENRQRNAHIKQNRSQQSIDQRDYFSKLGLTKRNAEYMFRFNRQFSDVNLAAEKKEQIQSDMVKELLANQKSGGTARNMYGTVKQRINSILHPVKPKEKITANYWPNAIYNALIFLALFNILYGVTFLFSLNNGAKNQGAAGITTLLITSLVAGLGMPIITRLFDANIQHKYSGIMRFLMMIAMFLGWIILFLVAVIIPRGINPVLNPLFNIIIAVIAIAACFYIKHKYNVTTGFLTTPRRN